MSVYSTEFEVYSRLIEFLTAEAWNIICACPPAGTDYRYPKCVLPRRDLGGSEKGPRDEVDLAAYKDNLLILAECKATLSDSFTVLNALGECDYNKLKRIIGAQPPGNLAALFRRGTGVAVPRNVEPAPVLVVGTVDAPLPLDMTVMQFANAKPKVFLAGALVGKF
jgi:hypothetical protein